MTIGEFDSIEEAAIQAKSLLDSPGKAGENVETEREAEHRIIQEVQAEFKSRLTEDYPIFAPLKGRIYYLKNGVCFLIMREAPNQAKICIQGDWYFIPRTWKYHEPGYFVVYGEDDEASPSIPF